jgi:hypothetical protein
MINLLPVWSEGIFGQGVRVRINDDGVDQDNVHFRSRFDVSASCDNEQEYLSSSSKQHGTSVASIVGASGDEDACAVGIAPQVMLSLCYALKPNESFLGEKVDQMDISQNSFERPACKPYGNGRRRELEPQQCPFKVQDDRPEHDPCQVCSDFSGVGYDNTDGMSSTCIEAIVKHCNRYYVEEKDACSGFLDIIIGGECSYTGLSTVASAGIVKGVTEGRGGLGVIYIFASGNSYFEGDDTNLKGYTNSVSTIRTS